MPDLNIFDPLSFFHLIHPISATGATMIYQAMFDEMDEGTAIFKCANDPPIGESPFLTYEGLPSDYYLWLVGTGKQMITGQIPVTETIPDRN